MNKKDAIIMDGALYIEGDRIIDVGTTARLAKEHGPEDTIDAKGKIVMPGFVNCHSHSVASLVRGLGADMYLFDWMKKLKLPYYTAMRESDAYNGSLLSYVENIKNGCTCIVDHYYPSRENKKNVDSIAQAALDSGVRAAIARTYHEEGEKVSEIFIESRDEILGEYRRIIRKWNGRGQGRLMTWLGPDNLLFSTLETIKETHLLASANGVGMHCHLSETVEMDNMIRKKFGKGSIEVFYDLGVLDPKFQAAHLVIISDREIELLAKTGASAINNIVTNTFLADGVSPVTKMLRAGVNVALGTDATGTYGTQDMFLSMKFAAAIHKLNAMDPTAITAKDVLRMATRNGARALGLQDEIGSIEIGKKADVILVDTRKPHITPFHDITAAIVYLSRSDDVDTTIVDGKVLMKNREMVGIDELSVMEKAAKSSESLIRRMS
ncbi:MAG TPA: amidohydrolase [Candidatus Bathyarchaeia archaeon]|nr:amidohydrolase [Candidatus Bathyarchaeia archaeon]